MYIDFRIIIITIVFLSLSFLTIKYVKKNTKRFICISGLFLTATIAAVNYIPEFILSKDIENKKLYSSIYFGSMRFELLRGGITHVNNLIQNDIANKKLITNLEYYAEKLPIPYDILKSIVSFYKNGNVLQIPQEELIEISNFMDNKLDLEQYRLRQTNSENSIKQFIFDIMAILDEYYNMDINNEEEYNRIMFKMYNEITGLMLNSSKNILIDYNNSMEFIKKCEIEYKEYIKRRKYFF